MKKVWIAGGTALCLLLSACGGATEEELVAQALSLELPKPASISYEDTHGGAHGDGETFAVLTFDENTAQTVESMLSEADWKALPMEENLSLFAFGGEKDGMNYTYNALASHNVAVPEQGWYWFLDRHSEAEDAHSAEGLLDRASINCSLALYDADKDTLYYYEMDT